MMSALRAGMMLVLLAALASCRQSTPDRERDARERAAAHAATARSAVVQSLASPREPGRLIYDKPTDLSYRSLHATRPDLDSAKIHDTPSAAEQGSRNTNRAEKRTPPHGAQP